MALAKYFSKDLLALSRVLRKAPMSELTLIVERTVVGIAFDGQAALREGEAALDMTVRLIARLYSKIRFVVPAICKDKVSRWEELAKQINSDIEFSAAVPDCTIAIGTRKLTKKTGGDKIFYIGSDGWVAKFSNARPVGSGNSTAALAAGFAACVGTSNLFRYVFSNFFDQTGYDVDFSLSLLDFFAPGADEKLIKNGVSIDKVVLVGFGAIGNGALWALWKSPFLKGKITVVEPEKVETSNLQRYVLAEERHIGGSKLLIAEEYLKGRPVQIESIGDDWETHLNSSRNWMNECVLMAVDSARARIAIQSSLPRQVINSYTDNNLIGIGRHYNFGSDACAVCTYMPMEETKSFASEVCAQLGLDAVALERQIGGYLYGNIPVDPQLLRWVSAANNIPYHELEKFMGVPMRDFYSRVVCGGVLLKLSGTTGNVGVVEAPLAFQSALAGILLVTELIVLKAGFRQNGFLCKTDFYPLSPIGLGVNPYTHSFPKDASGRCICNDNDFLEAYHKKWLQ